MTDIMNESYSNNTSNSTYGFTELDAGTKYWMIIHPILMAVITTIFVLIGICANLLLIISIIKKRLYKDAINILLVNLATASLVFEIFCAPILILHDMLYLNWRLGEVMCKLVPYLMHVSLYVISYTLMVTCLYLYLLVHHLGRKLQRIDTPKWAVVICLLMWIILLFCNIPRLLGYELLGKDYVQCYNKELAESQTKAQLFVCLYFLFFMAFPLVGMLTLNILTLRTLTHPTTTYDRLSIDNVYKKRISEIVMLSLVIFAVCWVPFQLISMINVFSPLHTLNHTHAIAFDVCLCLAFLNPTVNPVIFLLLHNDINTACHSMMTSCCGGHVRVPHDDTDDETDMHTPQFNAALNMIRLSIGDNKC